LIVELSKDHLIWNPELEHHDKINTKWHAQLEQC
jgi:hypothetical protein